MGFISLQVPQAGQPNTTEDAKVSSDLTIIQTWANGNVDDSNLFSPNNSYRRLLLQANGEAGTGQTAGLYNTQDAPNGQNGLGVPMFVGDAGLSSQPQDFAVTNKTAYARVRVSALSNNTPLGTNLTWGLYRVTSVSGGAGALNITLGTLVTGSTAAMNAPVANSALSAESAQFALPVDGNVYVFGLVLAGTSAAASLLSYTVSLLGYNA